MEPNILNELHIARKTKGKSISLNFAISLVGEAKLWKLWKEGKIEGWKNDESKQNSRWNFDLWDCLKHC